MMITALLNRRGGVATARLILLAVLILGWWVAVATGVLSRAVVPDPLDLFSEFFILLGEPAFWRSVWLTLSGALVGLIAAAVIGVPLGMITGRIPQLDLSTRFVFDFGRAYPAIALLTVLVLLLGASQEMKSVLVFIAVVFPIIIQTQQGARKVPAGIDLMARSFGIPRWLFATRIMLPWVAPYVATGLRLMATVSVLVALGAEVLAGAPGLGRDLTLAQSSGNTPIAYAYILAACLLGAGINVAAAYLRDRAIRWRPAEVGD